MNQVIIPNSMFAIIKAGTESNPEYYVGTKYHDFMPIPAFGVCVGSVLQMIVFFEYETASIYADEITDVHKQSVEILNLVTGEVVK